MIYLGIHDLPIYNFDKILNTDNYAYLIVDWNERDEVDIPEEATERWKEIVDQFYARSKDTGSETRYFLTLEKGYLETKHFFATHLILSLSESNKEEIAVELKGWGIDFDAKKSLESQLDSLDRQLRILQQDINIANSRLEALKEEDGEDQEGSSLVASCLKIERTTGIKINIRKDSVETYLEAFKLSEEINQQSKVNG